jgi:preprotein translocase subunit YajC
LIKMNVLYFLMMAPPKEGESSNPLTTFLPFILIFVIIYFFMIRPQSRKAKEQRRFHEDINKGDKIVTIGGLHGKILEIKDKTMIIEVGNGIKLTIQREAISMESTRALNQSNQGKTK